MRSIRVVCLTMILLCLVVLLSQLWTFSSSSSSSPSSDASTLLGSYGFSPVESPAADFLHSSRRSQMLYSVKGGYSGEHKVAVVLPFIGLQTWKVLHAWQKTWNRYAPCTAPLQGGLHNPFSATLFLYFDQDLAQDSKGEQQGFYNATLLKNTLMDTWKRLPHQQCFTGGLQFIDSTKGELNHIEGSCVMFYDLFAKLESQHFQHFMWMEPDVLPVQKGWLERMMEEVADNAQCQRWWIKGSNPQCASWYGKIRDRHDYHHNGNALYCLGSSRFAEFRQRVINYYPGGTAAESMNAGGCATGQSYELGMDHAMFQYRLRPDTFDYSKTIMSKFVYTDFIQNHCQEPYDSEAVVQQEPSTFLVHSGASFRDPSITKVSIIFNTHFQREPSPEEKARYGVRLDLGELVTQEDVIKSICVDQGLMNHIQYERCRLPTNTATEGQPVVSFDESSTKAVQIASALGPWAKRWPDQLYLWSTDLHSGPSMCNSEVYRRLNIVSHLEIDFDNCHYHGVCKDRLEVLSYNDWHGFSLDPCPHRMREQFYTRYKADPEMQRVDLIVCSHPASNCELYLPLNKSLIVFATTRLEFGRYDAEVGWRKSIMEKQSSAVAGQRWREWIHNIRLIASSPRNLIAANSLYDKYYIEHFTGLRNVRFLPSLCKPKNAGLLVYSPFRSQFLIGPSRDNLEGSPGCSKWGCQAWENPLWIGLQAALNDSNTLWGTQLQAVRIREMYQNFELQDVLNHRALIVFPYQSSTMMLTEMYRANVPLLAPTRRFLQEWDTKYSYLYERVYGHPQVLPETRVGRDNDTSQRRPDPNSKEPEALSYWLALFDIYTLPHITLFDSWRELAYQLRTMDFRAIHEVMRNSSAETEERIVEEWRTAIASLDLPQPGTASVAKPHLSINAAIQANYPGKSIWPVNARESCPGSGT